MAAILSSRRNFLPEAIPDFEYATTIAMSICDILSFDRCSSSNIDRAIGDQSFDLFWDPMTSSMTRSTIVCKGIFTIQ